MIKNGKKLVKSKLTIYPITCIVDHQEKSKTYLTPDVDFEEIEEGVEKIKTLMN